MDLEQEINKRKTFGIISHPDAGKTTLTEKLLLFGGAIQTAGAVKAKRAARQTTSDFMEIEKQRGISVATSVMGFNYQDKKINLLDTPGHQDFSEDTYRTLTAVDSALMVIDSTKGVESQTYKLMEICRMRNIPTMTFINKLDREGRDPIDLLDEIEDKLQISVYPLSWPIGTGKTFKGVYSIIEKKIILFKSHQKQDSEEAVEITDLSDPKLDELLKDKAEKLRDDIELICGVYPEFNPEDYLAGHLTPIFFGSAVNNFGVRELLDAFIKLAPSPGSRLTDINKISPDNSNFSGFIFKIHANIDPKHRDRIAFLRVCSGTFKRNKRFYHVRSGKNLKSSNPTAFMAQSKEIIDAAYPGDVIGLHDTGNFKIGDTLTSGNKFNFKGIPHFSPELFKYTVNLDPLKSKQLNKGLAQLCEEGVAQFFIKLNDTRKIIGTVGALQFEVIQHRLEHEYGAKCRFDNLNYVKAAWLICKDKGKLEKFIQSRKNQIAKDKDENYIYLAETRWSLDREIKENPDIIFHNTSEFQ
ncbi:MAG: peptide chain release factor 3 [bacterium]|nr:peptide chain release factor 3 [bacterium]